MNDKALKGLVAGIYDSTGKHAARTADIMEQVARLMSGQAARQGGPVSPSQAAILAGMFTGNFDRSVMLQNTSVYEKLNGGIAAGGRSPGEQLMLWKLAGGDKYSGSWSSLEDVQVRMKKGLSDPEFRENFKGFLKNQLADDAQRRLTLHSMFGLGLGEGGEADLALKYLINAAPNSSIDDISKAMERDNVSKDIIGTITGKMKQSTTRDLAVEREAEFGKFGQSFGPAVQKLEDALLKTGDKFLQAANRVHNATTFFKNIPQAVKEGAGELWDSGPLGKTMVAGGTAYGGWKVYQTGKKVLSLGKKAMPKIAEVGRSAGKGAGRGGPIGTAIMVGTELMYGEMADVDEAALVKRARNGSPGAESAPVIITPPSTDMSDTNRILRDIYNLLAQQGQGGGRPVKPSGH